MKKKKWLIPIMILATIIIFVAICIGVMVIKGLGCSIGRYLVTANGTSMLVLDASPVQMSNRTDSDLFDKLNIGDKILVLHDGIAESYPGKTGAYAVFRLSKGSTTDIPQTVIDGLSELGWMATGTNTKDLYFNSGSAIDNVVTGVTVSYANWTGSDMLYFGGLNADKMMISSVQHLPIYKFDTTEELERFKETYGEMLCFDQNYNEVPSFNEATARYDESFFEDSSLFVVYVSANSGSYRFAVDSIYCDGTNFCVQVKRTNNSDSATDDMAGWFVTVAFDKASIENCTRFDADLVN